jgi:bifunctional DNase/RNase
MSYSQSQSGAYALILGEIGGKRRLPIIIGGFEAQAIAIELERMKPSRPLTHDLFKSFSDTFNISISEVVINKFVEGVFHAELVCSDGNSNYRIDARTSDAVAIALRFQCPIYTFEKIMAAAGIVVDDQKEPEVKEKPRSKKTITTVYDQYSLEELKNMLQKSVTNEEYEKASKIRDEIKRREESKK